MSDLVRRERRFDAVVFDMDGLLVDTEPLYIRAMQRAASDLGFEIGHDFMVDMIGRNQLESNRRLGAALGAGFPLHEFGARWPVIWSEITAVEGIRQKPGVPQVLSLLDRHGLARAIATSSGSHQAVRTLELAGLADAFPVRVTGEEVRRSKPAPDIFLEAADRLGVAPSRCIALEDSGPGLLAARAAGMTALMVPDIKPPTNEVAAAAHAVLASLEIACPVIRDLIGDEPVGP